MSDTPRTDAACHSVYGQGVAYIPLVGFMESLERDLANMTDQRDAALWVIEKKDQSIAELEQQMREAYRMIDGFVDCNPMEPIETVEKWMERNQKFKP